MKKTVVLLIVLAALVGFALFYGKMRDNNLNSAKLVGVKDREYLFPDLPIKEIRQVVIREGTKTVTLAVEGDRWTVKERDGYTAAYDKIAKAVGSIADLKLQGKTLVGRGALGEVNLLPPGEGAPEVTGLQVELKNEKGETVGSFVAGRSVESAGGASSGNFMGGPGQQRWVRTPKDENTIWLIGESLFDIQAEPKEWLDKAYVDVQEIKSVAVTHENAADSWSAERKDLQNPFLLQSPQSGEELDTAKTDGLNRALSAVVFNDVLTKDKATPEFLKGATKIKLVTFKGFTYEVQILEKKEGESDPKYFMTVTKVSAELPKTRQAPADEKPEDKKKLDEEFVAANKVLEAKLEREKAFEGRVYEVTSYGVSDLLKKRSEILRDKTAEAPASPGGAAPTPAPGTPPALLTPMAPAPSPVPPPAPAPAPPVSKPKASKPAEPVAPASKPEASAAPKADAPQAPTPEAPKAEEKKGS